MRRIDPSLGIIDHSLATLACLLAVYSIGMSLNNDGLAVFFTVGIFLTATAGYSLSKIVRGKKIASYDSYFWAIGGMAATGLINVINPLLPGGGFPFELLAAGILCWVLLIGNLFAWRDQTLIFLSLPCIAIFGLVGTFDTFSFGTALFFLFMLSIAVLYARSHQRAMIERAMRAGFESPELLNRGPWKWMAGPEWALVSALSIILFSFMGAPVLRGSLSTVAGQVQVSLPQQRTNQPGTTPREIANVRVGTGPTFLSEQVVVKARMDRPRYLRLNSFSTYTGDGWRGTPITLPSDTPLVGHKPNTLAPERGPNGGILTWPGHDAPPQEPIANGKVVEFTIKDDDGTFNSLIAPGPVTEVKIAPQSMSVLGQGAVILSGTTPRVKTVTAYALVPSEDARAKRSILPPALEPISDIFLSKRNVPARVRDLSYSVTKDATTDYEKAIAIKRAIEQRVVYNIKAGRTPRAEDPVEYFLFDSQEGYCDLFASSMTVMARSVGLHSRYTVGYLVNDTERDEEGYYTIRGKDYHAWSEIYFEGVGWIAFDPTEGADSVGGGERGASDNIAAWYKSDGFKAALSLVLVASLALPVVIALRKRSLTQSAREGRVASDLARLHASFYRAIEKFVDSPKRFSQTTREFVQNVGEKLGPLKADTNALVTDFESAMFSQRIPDGDIVKSLAARTAELRFALGRLKKQRP